MKGILAEFASKLEHMQNVVEKKEMKEDMEEEEEVPDDEEDELSENEKPLIKDLKALGGKPTELPMFTGKVDAELVLEWIEALENHFECEKVSESQQVKLDKSRMKGAALTWWNFVQEERVKEDKRKICSWKKMVSMIRETYLPEDYEIQLHQKRQNLRERDMDICTYTEEFQKLSLRSKFAEPESIKVERYLNGLRMNIQEELQLLSPNTVAKCYQLALKVEEKIKRRQENNNRGRGRQPFRGRGSNFQPQTEMHNEVNKFDNFKGSFRGRRPNFRGRSPGRMNGPIRCYNCNQEGLMAHKCIAKASSSTHGERRIHLTQEGDFQEDS